MWYWHEGMGWWMLFGGLWTLIFWVLIIVLIVWAIKKVAERGSGSGGTGKRDPLDIAKERYAKGEISKEQFEQIKKDLHSPVKPVLKFRLDKWLIIA
jgi:putative membrane protein